MLESSDHIIIRELVDRLQQINQDEFDSPEYKREDNIHRIFLYPAMMIPVTQKMIIEIIAKYLPSDANMIDPFMGSSTSILSCMEVGLNAFGQDINPLAVLISKVKTGSLDYNLFQSNLSRLTNNIEQDKSSEVSIHFDNINKWFTPKSQNELSKIKRAIHKEPDIHSRRFFWVILAETIRISSNDRTSTYKLHQRPIEEIQTRDIAVIEEFSRLAKRSIKDIKKFKEKLESNSLLNNGNYKGNVSVKWGNTMQEINSSLQFSLLVSSPPYGDNHTTVTYGQHSFLELQWIDKNDIDENIDYDFLRTTQEIDRKSLGGIIDSKKINTQKQNLYKKTPALESFINDFSPEDRDKSNKIISFIDDFDKSLDVIVPKLSKDAFLVWTIGNRSVAKKEVPNDQILIELMQSRNIPLIHQAERTILNKIMPNRNKTSKTMDKEKILIFHKAN